LTQAQEKRFMNYSFTLPEVLKIADIASEKVLSIYMTDFKVNYKADDSPITAADLASHRVIMDGLRQLSRDIPVLSEEGAGIPWEERKHCRRFWLIDPTPLMAQRISPSAPVNLR
jgi:3'(2'), 5'-bisphosphate nucleotidase